MNAREIVKALGGSWHGSYGTACCPAHKDRTPSLSIRDGDDGALLTHCHAGCSPEAVWASLQDRGLVERDGRRHAARAPTRRQGTDKPPEPSRNQNLALELWRAARPASGTLAESYLRGRGITVPVPLTIRDHPGLKHSPTGQNFPAMVAAITGADRRVIAIHRTFLRCDGRDKANVSAPKLSLGAMRDGAVRLGSARPALGLAEGIETALSAMQMFNIPVWAALGSRLDRVELPECVVEVHIFGDNGRPGHEAAERAAKAYLGQGCRVVVRFPPEQFGDWNDALRAEAAA